WTTLSLSLSISISLCFQLACREYGIRSKQVKSLQKDIIGQAIACGTTHSLTPSWGNQFWDFVFFSSSSPSTTFHCT
ncbi:hypothetical protein GYH30_056228, partial [Glycine max]